MKYLKIGVLLIFPLTNNAQFMSSQKMISGFSGSASLKQEYGFIPYLYNSKSPAYMVTGALQFGFVSFGLPLQFELHQSNKQAAYGIGSYFTLSFDAPSYKRMAEQKLNDEKSQISYRLDSLNYLKSDLEKKLNYIEVLKLKSIREKDFILPDDKYFLLNGSDVKGPMPDSLLSMKTKQDSIIKTKLPQSSIDSLSTQEIIDKYNNLRRKMEKVNSEITTANDKLNNLETIRSVADSLSTLPLHHSWLQKLKKFEIGLATPSYSDWLINCPIKGINIQTESLESFYSVSYGTVVDYNYLNVSLKFDHWKNAEADFDNIVHFNSADNGRKIIAGQVGYGNKDKSYIAIGFLRGIGHQNYYTLPSGETGNSILYDRNYVGELTGKVQFKSHSLKLTYAKSALINDKEEGNTIDKLTGEKD